MALVNLKSTLITNRDATPKVLTDSYVSGGGLCESEGYVTTNAADNVGSTYRLCSIPSNARVSSIILSNGAMGGATAANIGVYYPTFIPLGSGLTPANASAAISASFFASALSLVAAANQTEVVNQSGTNTIALQELPIWQAIGLTSDPGIMLDIVAALSAVTTSGALLGMKVKFVE